MRLYKYLVTLSAVFLIACNFGDDNKKVCNTDNPLEDIKWLKETKTAFDMSMSMARKQIIQYRYEDKDVFMIVRCVGCPDAEIDIYDCEKNLVCQFGGKNNEKPCPDFKKNATGKKIIYDK